MTISPVLGTTHRVGDAVRRFAERAIRPGVDARDSERRWDPVLFAGLAATGLVGALVPAELGGGGCGATEVADALVALGEAGRDYGLALATVAHAVLTAVPIRALGTRSQREEYLPALAGGELVGSVSLRQTQGAAAAPAVLVHAAATGDGSWLLGGELDLVPQAASAGVFLVVAQHPDGTRTAFLVDHDTPGVSVDRTAPPPAAATCAWGRVVLDGCVLGPDAVLGAVGGAAAGVEPLLASLDWTFTSAVQVGIIRALATDSIVRAGARTLFGRPVTHVQSERLSLSDMASRGELAWNVVRLAAESFDEGRPSHLHAATARHFTARAARFVADRAAQVLGATGCAGDQVVERAHRDALFFSETGGGPEVLRPVIAANLLGLG